MPITLDQLCQRLRPETTSLLLGAGASIPSGAPSGTDLAKRLWRKVANQDAQSSDLVETASLLERRYSRRSVVDAIVSILKPLRPTGGLLALPTFGWRAVFSTNFDQLVERAYKKANVGPLIRIRSNYDLSHQEARTDTTLYKIHGCISQDRSLGNKASLVLTEQDYDDYDKYRQSLFALLNSHLLTGDVLIIGQSLADRHLSDLIKRVLQYKFDGAPGEVYVLVYDQDDLRAPLLEDRGAKIAFGGLDEFVHAMATVTSASDSEPSGEPAALPVTLVSIVEDVDHAKLREPNIIKMFNGSPATYSDIRAGATFERSNIELQVDQLADKSLATLAIVGAAGVGKTTLARQILAQLHERGIIALEHRSDFQFLSQPWIQFESELRGSGRRAVLLLDECTRYMRQANILVERLSEITDAAVSVVLTANAAQWEPRLKSPKLFSQGRILRISRLEDPDLHALINLVEYNRQVGDLVQTEFKALTRRQQFQRLRERCSADMFVCLKNIFANDSLDQILLTEYAELNDAAQEHYRYIAALESVGMRVHRQLIMRMLSVRADAVAPMLASLVGIIDEFEINAKEGVYGWATRHLVIARKITDYKFSSLEELESLFRQIIENINPAVPTELQSIRDLCDQEFGIGRLAESSIRKDLYRRLIDIVPAERIPWHRLIRELLFEGDFEQASYAIRDAKEAVGADGPIDRYGVRLLVARAEMTAGIEESDRVALLRQAYEVAMNNIAKHHRDKHAYRALCDVALKLIDNGEPRYILEEAVARMREAADEILDPDMDKDLRHYELMLARQ